MSFEEVVQQFMSFNDIKKWIKENKIVFVSSLVFIIALSGGWYYFRVFRAQQIRLAYEALNECLDETMRAYQNPSLWDEAEIAAHTGLRQFGNWEFKPYFKTIQAEALLREGDAEHAYLLLGQAHEEMAKASPFYGYVLIKKLLIGVDLGYEGAISSLESLAQDKTSSVQDMALYFLGNYYFLAHDTDRARDIWQKLVELFETKGQGLSPWARHAQTRLERLNS